MIDAPPPATHQIPPKRRLLTPPTLEFSGQVVLLVVAFAALNASNYAFHIVASRILGPGSYGELAALLALLMILSVPLSVVQTAVAKRTAEGAPGRRADAATRATVRALLPSAFLAGLAMAVATPILAGFLHTTWVEAVLLAPYTLLAVLASVPLGTLQGERRFLRYVVASLAGAAARIGAGAALMTLGFGVAGAMTALVLSQAVLLLVALRLTGVRVFAGRGQPERVLALRGELGRTFLGLGAFWTLAELDILLARHFLEEDAAGLYSSAALVARGLLFIVAAIGVAGLPRFAQSIAHAGEASRWLHVSLCLVGVASTIGVVGLVALRELLIPLAFGAEYAEAAALLPALAVGVAFLALLLVLVYFHVAAGTRAYLFILGGIAAEALLVLRFHDSPAQIALVFVCVSGLVAGALLHAALAVTRYAPKGASVSGEPPTLELSVVVPCHNAAASLGEVLTRIHESVRSVPSHEIVVVSDGSTDRTVEIARGASLECVRVLEYRDRVGKGHALRLGLGAARGRYVAFIDADGDVDPESLRPFVELMRMYEPDIVLGSKRHPLSEVDYPLLRRILSWGYHKLCRALFRVDVRDTQTGLKLVRREVLDAVLPRMLEKRFAFDLELVVVARRFGFRRVFEAPVTLDFRFGSTINVRATARIFVDTLAIFYRRYVLDTYHVDPSLRVQRKHLASRSGRRIVIVNWKDVRHPAAGGAETYVHELARRWVAHGHVVEQISAGFSGGARVEWVDGVRIRRVGRLRNGTFHLLVQRELRRARTADVLVESINTLPFLSLRHRRFVPVVAVVYQLAGDVWDAELPRPLAALGRRIEPMLLRLYRSVPTLTISRSTERDLRALGFEDVAVVAPGVDSPERPVRLAKEATPTLAYVGRLEANKRPAHAVAAFSLVRKLLPEARLWVIGQGSLGERLRESAPEGVELLGRLPRAELYERLERAHCVLVPSVREGWGLVVIEANSVGTPAAGYDVAGLRDSILENRTGLLCEAGNVEALADAALALLGDHRYHAICKEAEEWAGRFSWDVCARDALAFIESRARPTAEAIDAIDLAALPSGAATGT